MGQHVDKCTGQLYWHMVPRITLTPSKTTMLAQLEDLLKALCKNGLKILPKKGQLFNTELQYMSNTIFIKDRRVCVIPLQSRLETIHKLKPPMTIKGCKSLLGW